MTVSELITALQTCSPDSQVILQRDPEGNGYSPLAGVDADVIYVPETTWRGAVYNRSGTADDADMDEDDWAEFLAAYPTCVTLHPVG